jgi:cobalt-zinc-cadmium efflux system protein
MPQGHPGDAFVQTVVTTLRAEYSMHHATVQVEFGMACQSCVLHERGHVH